MDDGKSARAVNVKLSSCSGKPWRRKRPLPLTGSWIKKTSIFSSDDPDPLPTG